MATPALALPAPAGRPVHYSDRAQELARHSVAQPDQRSGQRPAGSAPRRGHGYVGGTGARFWPSQDVLGAAHATVAVLPGRGETPDMFEDVAFRLALDGFEVTLLGPGEGTDAAIGELRVPGVPLVVLGSDTGALRALVAAGSPALRPDALVLLGLPMLYRAVDGELPTDPPPRALPDLPILLVHGEVDGVSPLHLVQLATRTAPRAQLHVVPGGHQILAGPGGRSVAARTLLFVEGLRAAHDRRADAAGYSEANANTEVRRAS